MRLGIWGFLVAAAYSRFRMGIWGFLVAAAYGPGMLSAAFVPRWIVIAVGVALIGPLDSHNLAKPVRWLLLAALLAGSLSVLFSPDPRGGLLELFYFAALCGVLVVASGFDSIESALRGLCAGLAISSVLCVWQTSGWSPVPQSSAPAGLFYNREVLAEFAAVLVVWALLRREWLCVSAAIVPVLLCNSRVAFAAIAVGLFAAWRAGWRTKAFMAGVIVICGLASLFVLGFDKFASGGTRIVIWGATAMAVTPLGHGLGWFLAVHPAEQFAHSDLLQAFAELGIGAMPLILIFLVALICGKGNRAERAAFIAISVECVVSFPLHVPASAFLAFLLAGYLVRNRVGICGDGYGGGIDHGADLLRCSDAGTGNHETGRSRRRAFSV